MERVEIRPAIKFDSLPISFAGKNDEKVLDALFIAAQVHEGDKRKLTGEPYLHHCIAVADILKSWGADEDEIVAGLLHDTVEDHPDIITLNDIRRIFGDRVAFLVDGVTKMKSREGDKNEFETLRKVTRESLIEPGVALVKLADRLHNMMTLDGMKPATQQIKAKETLAVYAPLAESFGLWQVKNALEDLSFMYIDPVKYAEVREIVDNDPRLDVKYIKDKEKEIRVFMERAGISVRLEHQVGGYWELYDKQKKSAMRSGTKHQSYFDITDLVSFRVILSDENISDCYKAMGVMRMMYGSKLEKQRHDDYLMTPAINGYCALHDTFKFPEGNIEIAYTTVSRERFNNWGVVSLENNELRLNKDKYLRKLVFTPKEELVFMEPGATGIDVAYKLSETLGLRSVAMIIDGRLADLSEVVPNVSLVEIITDTAQEKPQEEWLTYCNEETRRAIEQQMVVVDHDKEVNRGRLMLAENVLKERGLLSLDDMNSETINRLLLNLGCWYGLPDLYYKFANGLDPKIVKKNLDEVGIVEGVYSTLEVTGKNYIGVSSEIAEIVARNGGDTRMKIEQVTKDERFLVRIIMVVDKEGKDRIAQEINNKFGGCVVV